MKPTHRPTTAEPTNKPTHRPTTSEPTMKPTHRPTTSEPTPRPTHRPTTSDPTTARPTTSNPTTSNPTTAEPTKRPTVSHDDCPSDDIGLAANGQHCTFHGRCEYDFVECCGERGPTIACTCEDQRVRCIAACPTVSPTPEPTRPMTVDPTPGTTAEPTKKPTRPITVDPTPGTTSEPTKDQSGGWGEPKPTRPIRTPR